jgi:hypothetical protein
LPIRSPFGWNEAGDAENREEGDGFLLVEGVAAAAKIYLVASSTLSPATVAGRHKI